MRLSECVCVYVSVQVLMCVYAVEPHLSSFLSISSFALSFTTADSLVVFALWAMCMCMRCVCPSVYVCVQVLMCVYAVEPHLSSFLSISSCALSSTMAASIVALALWAVCVCVCASAYVCVYVCVQVRMFVCMCARVRMFVIFVAPPQPTH